MIQEYTDEYLACDGEQGYGSVVVVGLVIALLLSQVYDRSIFELLGDHLLLPCETADRAFLSKLCHLPCRSTSCRPQLGWSLSQELCHLGVNGSLAGSPARLVGHPELRGWTFEADDRRLHC